MQYLRRTHFASLRKLERCKSVKVHLSGEIPRRRLVGILLAGGCKVGTLTLDITAEKEGDDERSDVEQDAHEWLRRTQREQRPMACLHQR